MFCSEKHNQVSNVYLDSRWCLEIACWKHNMHGSEGLGNTLIQKNNVEDGVKIWLQGLLSLSCNFKIVELIIQLNWLYRL